jgi:hypothetical protein
MFFAASPIFVLLQSRWVEIANACRPTTNDGRKRALSLVQHPWFE